ncbi:hypothetical protein [Desulfopila inferna]|uniref:hypothetical protein n=1 Tax=Desulfopila inferna TaxID=468528 RepID=UPI001965EFDF|nr:hypothetical protein [Desulfopila inferna]MBM9606105.1 hypothetical protein [Desulfopila inferna]
MSNALKKAGENNIFRIGYGEYLSFSNSAGLGTASFLPSGIMAWKVLNNKHGVEDKK